MPAKDIFHDIVKTALIKEGWTITDDPLFVSYGVGDFCIDLGATTIAAQKSESKIAIEIKSFLQPSTVNEFHTALGQYLNYQIALEENDPSRPLYLAVSGGVYTTFFQQWLPQTAIKKFSIKLVVFDELQEEIIEWIE